MKEEFFKRLYKNMDKEEIIRVATEDKIRADRNARLLHKAIEKNKNIVDEKDKEIERLHYMIKEVREYIENNTYKIEWGDLEQDNEDININEDLTEKEFIEGFIEILDKENK